MQNFELPLLYGVSKTGKIKQWQAKVEEHENNTASIIIESGYVGGKIRETSKRIKKGKNIGKSNETTPYKQAIMQIKSSWVGKRNQNYETERMDLSNYIPRLMLPQLAQGMGKGKIIYPAYIQPKLNGICNLAEYNPIPMHHSRGGHIFSTLQHLDKWLTKLNAPAPVHGELYVHGWSLQKIGSYTKKIKPNQYLLEYWLYDIGWMGVEFEKRIEWLNNNIKNLTNRIDIPIKFTPTELVNNYSEAKLFHNKCVQNGFEGAMLKNAHGLYTFQYRSNDIEKLKEFKTDEFQIVNGKEGTGSDEGCIIYQCITKDGLVFDARPRGTVEDRQEMLSNLSNDIGKMLTIRYAELSDLGIPLQPVGIPEAEVVRDYE